MKKIFTLLFIASSFAAFSQFGIKISQLQPTGKFGKSMKPAFGGEIVYKHANSEDESGLHLRGSIGFARFNPRLDTFPTYGTQRDWRTGITTVYPGYMVIHRYTITTVSFGADYRISAFDNLFIYPGVDIGGLFNRMQYDYHVESVVSASGFREEFNFVSLRLRVGGEYMMNESVGVFAEATRCMNYSWSAGGLAYNDFGIGVRYIF